MCFGEIMFKVFEADPDAVKNNRARVVSLTNKF
jgi:hypothetical protein